MKESAARPATSFSQGIGFRISSEVQSTLAPAPPIIRMSEVARSFWLINDQRPSETRGAGRRGREIARGDPRKASLARCE